MDDDCGDGDYQDQDGKEGKIERRKEESRRRRGVKVEL
jgi:hypothetical protein